MTQQSIEEQGTIPRYFVEDCPEHTFVWFSDERGSHHQLGEYLIETYLCTNCGIMQRVLLSLEGGADSHE